MIITSFKEVNTWQNSRSYCIFLSVYSKDKRDNGEEEGRGMTLYIMYKGEDIL